MRRSLLTQLGIPLTLVIVACSGNAADPGSSPGDFSDAELVIGPLPDGVAGLPLPPAEALVIDHASRTVREDANGELFVHLFNPDFDGQLLGSRTIPLQRGVASLAGLGVSAAGTGYTLIGTWKDITGISPEFSVQSASDVVRVSGATGPVGVFALGSDTRGSTERRMEISTSGVVEVGALSESTARHVPRSMAVAFPLDGRPPAAIAPQWTVGADDVELRFEDPVTIGLTFWVVHGDLEAVRSDIQSELDHVREIFADQKTGLVLDEAEIVDSRASPFADELQRRRYGPGYRDSLMVQIGSRSDRINFYVLNQFIEHDGTSTLGIGVSPNFSVVSRVALKLRQDWVAHFLGRTLGLSYVSSLIAGFDTLNVMSQTPNPRSTLSEGQIYGIFTHGAVVDVFGRTPLPGGQLPVALRFEPDGAFPITPGVRRPGGS